MKAKKRMSYEELVAQAREARQEMPGKETFDEEVMALIRQQNKLAQKTSWSQLLFGWMEIRQVRYAMGLLALLITVSFFWQQGQIIYRMDQLENKMIPRQELAARQTVSYREVVNQLNRLEASDPEWISVEKEKLEDFMQQYELLQSEYQKLYKIIENKPGLKKQLQDIDAEDLINRLKSMNL